MRASSHRLFGLLLLGLTATSLTAEEFSQETLQEAREVAYLQIDEIADKIADNFRMRTWPLIERDLAGAYDRATLDALLSELTKLQKRHVLGVINDTPAIYARRFSAAELREINAFLRSPQRDVIAFYQTPVGQKTAFELEPIMREVMELMLVRKKDVDAQVSAVFAKVLREHGYSK